MHQPCDGNNRLVGSTVHITWVNVGIPEYNITLAQQKPYQGSGSSLLGQEKIYTKTASQRERGSEGINWTVSTQGLDQAYDSNIFYLILASPTVLPDNPGLYATFGTASHYINFTTNADDPAVTDPPPGLASASPSPNINPYLGVRQASIGQQWSPDDVEGSNSSSSSTRSRSTDSDKANAARRDIGLGVGLGFGIPVLALAMLAGWLALQLKNERRKSAGAMNFSDGKGAGSAGGWVAEKDVETYQELSNDAVKRTELPQPAVGVRGSNSMVPELPAGGGVQGRGV
ncbi:MAG: hypothetical protein M1831_005643 [Alyxoria varia]|nr:MAG: hypothetical protein M1831_005643 [Alyxoria varia]